MFVKNGMNKRVKLAKDGLQNYMKDPSAGLCFQYIHTRASGVWRYFFERGIQLLCSWIPGPVGLVLRMALYHFFFHRNAKMAFIEAGVDLFYMNAICFGQGVYVDRYCRIHASNAEIVLGNNNRVMKGAYLCTYVSNSRQGEGIVTGYDCWIGVNAVLGSGQGGLFMGNNVLIGPNAVIVTGNHDYESADLTAVEQEYYGESIHIGDNVWIGANAVILGGVTIGEHAVIAAGAVVAEDVAPYTVVGGVPSREILDIGKSV
jgi:acetyltransferase-like isoleucine patch superfamily enzyme